MEEYGDLSGIVFNRRSGYLIGGHQRIEHLPPESEIAIIERLEEPNEVGTVARGFVAVGSELWTYREVDVDEQTEAMMNLAANKQGGDFLFPDLPNLVSTLDAEGQDLGLAGFDPRELEELLAYSPALPDPTEGGKNGGARSVIEIHCDQATVYEVLSVVKDAVGELDVELRVS